MSSKIIQFPKKTTKELTNPFEDIISNMYALANLLEDDAFILEDEDGEEYIFTPDVGITLLLDQDGKLILQSNVTDYRLLEEILTNVLSGVKTINEEESEHDG